jgi:hypothetical protein
MKNEGSLPCSQKLATGSYPEPERSSSQPNILFKMHFKLCVGNPYHFLHTLI